MDYVKIGFTNDIRRRLAQLQVSSPHKLKLVALFEGDVFKEQELHKQFSSYWSCGEWFDKCEELTKYAESHSQDLLWKHGYLPNESHSPIGLIKTARYKNGITMEGLAEKLGITKQAVLDMETREVQGRISMNTLNKTLNALGHKLETRIIVL